MNDDRRRRIAEALLRPTGPIGAEVPLLPQGGPSEQVLPPLPFSVGGNIEGGGIRGFGMLPPDYDVRGIYRREF